MVPAISMKELQNASGAGVRVLIVDSGVETGHAALQGRPIRCWQVVASHDSYSIVSDTSGNDSYGHGTAVAGILHEFAPGATIESLRVLGNDLRCSSQMVLAGLRWAIKQGYDVLNCSFGTSNARFVAEYKLVVDQAFCRNVMMVSACNNYDFQALEYPGSFPTVISTDYGKLPGLDVGRRCGELVEFVARGEEIRVAWKGGGYSEGTGSSYAAPHLAAIIARLRQLQPNWNACEMKAALYQLAQPAARPVKAGSLPAPN
jgi:subtilisin